MAAIHKNHLDRSLMPFLRKQLHLFRFLCTLGQTIPNQITHQSLVQTGNLLSQHHVRVCQTKQKWSYHDSTPLRSVVEIYIAQKYLTFNHELKIHPAQSNLILQRILQKILHKLSKIQVFRISREKNSQIYNLQVLSHFY